MHRIFLFFSTFKTNYFRFSFLAFIIFSSFGLSAQTIIKGIVTDAKTGEGLPGITIFVKGTSNGAASDIDGNYELKVNSGKYTLTASSISYNTLEITDVEVKKGETLTLDIPMKESVQSLNELVVVGVARLTSEVSLLNSMRTSTSVISGISSQQISKNQDRDAAEVIKRIPGISVMDNKFIIARGLSQRYNNVWLNNSATPSSESDTRAFSFDLVPSSQIENLIIVKSPQPELPADFSGGFVKITTKGVPTSNNMELSYTTGLNTITTFKDFKYNPGSSADAIGFGSGFRELKSWVPNRLDQDNSEMVDNVSKNGFNNNWNIKTKKAIPDQRFSFAINRRIDLANAKQLGFTGAINYSNIYRTYENLTNTQYSVYDYINDKPFPEYEYKDNQYSNSVRLGAMANFSLILNNRNRIEFRNIFNQLSQDRYTLRTGLNYSNGTVKTEEKQEYLYSTRTIYSTQLAGKHQVSKNGNLDWTGGFSFADKNQPDRRIISREQNTNPIDIDFYEKMELSSITRNFIKMNEYIYSGTVNYTHKLTMGSLEPTLKTGLYGEYKTRDYKARDFNYLPNYVSSSFLYQDLDQILRPENFGVGTEKMPIKEETKNNDSYTGDNQLIAAYLGFNIPLEKLNIYAGARFEHNLMTLTNYTSNSASDFTTKKSDYKTTDVFPSLNISYNLNNNNILRFGYGMSVNRPEFREVSPSSYYDFDIFNRIKGNPDLKSAYIQNFDIRYEIYPSASELISVALFYKNFKNPIEWTFIHSSGGARIYTFENGLSANNFGVEVDIKKSLDFVGMKYLSLILNGSLIDSKVKFSENSLDTERALQGQSPYLLNAGIFYQNENLKLTSGLLYNIVGKRITGLGIKQHTEGSSMNEDIPDMYEMPRNVIDFNISKGFGKNFELSAGIKDILSQDIIFKQFPKFTDANGKVQNREQITKQFNPGRNITISGKITF